ncbi:STAS domain-containing protein [Streptomyces lonarensis]|uniref:STAS domain-containing protein n=1 Tax=Streptomyces lonarensis TaxID=700599 RepID=A0A7X6HXG5_9ACTN|nr:STAS domain-containing protein [Streptomyces lonarensis]NJQ04335.1 STAS domain-containing protein [Streptomyces lonarensis]
MGLSAAVVVTAPGSPDEIAGVAPRGEFDMDASEPLAEALTAALRSPSRGTLLDLSGLTFADSTLLGLLLSTVEDHREEGRALVIAGPFASSVWRVFTVTGVVSHLPLAADRREALGRLRSDEASPHA